MGLPGRISLARVLFLAVLLAWVPAPSVALAGAMDNRRTPPPGSAVDNPGTLPPGLAVDNPRTLPPGSVTLPVGGPTPGGAGSPTPAGAGSRTPGGAGSPTPAGAGSFVPGRLLVGFEARAGERARRAAAAAVDGQVVAGTGRTGVADLDRAADARADARDRAADVRVVALDRAADVRVAARRLAGRPEVAFAEPDWVRRVDACEPSVCWHLQPRPGADVVEAHGHGHTGAGRTVAVVDTGVATGVADLAGRSTSAGVAPTPAAWPRRTGRPAPTALRWPAWSPPSTTAPAPPASPPGPGSSPTGSTAPAAASPSPTCTRP